MSPGVMDNERSGGLSKLAAVRHNTARLHLALQRLQGPQQARQQHIQTWNALCKAAGLPWLTQALMSAVYVCTAGT